MSRPTGRYVEPRVGDGVLQWSAAEQMPLGYDVPPMSFRASAHTGVGIRFLCRAGPMCPAAGYAFFGGARGPRPTGRYVEPRETGRRGCRPLQNNIQTGTACSPSLSLCAFYTYRWVVTSNTPRVVMRRLGITGSAMKLSVMNGSMPVDTPSS